MSCDDDKECCKNEEDKQCDKEHGNKENCHRKRRCCHGKRKQVMRLRMNNVYL